MSDQFRRTKRSPSQRLGSVILTACCLVLWLSLNSRAMLLAPDLPRQQTQNETAEQHMQKAREALQRQEYEVAKQESKRALLLNKELPEANLVLGVIYRREGKRVDAQRYVKEAIKYKPDYADAHYILGLIHLDNKAPTDAREEVELALSNGLRFPAVYVLKAQAALAMQEPQEALDAFETALRLTPVNDETVANLKGQIEALRGWIDSRADRLDPSFVKPRLLNSPRPRYTTDAREAGIQGIVSVAVLVNEEGRVNSTLVFLGLGFGLDEEAVMSARQLKFSPATKNGRAIPFWQMVTVEFNLRRSFEIVR